MTERTSKLTPKEKQVLAEVDNFKRRAGKLMEKNKMAGRLGLSPDQEALFAISLAQYMCSQAGADAAFRQRNVVLEVFSKVGAAGLFGGDPSKQVEIDRLASARLKAEQAEQKNLYPADARLNPGRIVNCANFVAGLVLKGKEEGVEFRELFEENIPLIQRNYLTPPKVES